MSQQVRPLVVSLLESTLRAAPSRAIPFCAAALSAAFVLGTEAPVSGQDSASPPVARQQAQPTPPTNNFGLPLEGWVKVRYSVLADGTTAEVRVIDVMPPQMSTKEAVAAVEKWTFTPATVGGEPVDWYNNESIVVFDAENVPFEPSPVFAQAYVQVIELLNEEDYDKAKKTNRTLLETRTMRLNEIGLGQAQAAILNLRTSSLHEAYESIVRATERGVPTLQDTELASALRYRFGIELELGLYADSLETYERLAAIETLADDDIVKSRADDVREALQGEAAVIVKGRVDREPWGYTPSRRTFGFTDVDGTIRALQLECDRRKTELEFSADVEWSIPESWGQCKLFVDARRDTTFSLVEFPQQ